MTDADVYDFSINIHATTADLETLKSNMRVNLGSGAESWDLYRSGDGVAFLKVTNGDREREYELRIYRNLP